MATGEHPKADAKLARPAIKFRQSTISQPASRNIDDTIEADGVVRIVDDSEVGENVFYFLPLIEPHAHKLMRHIASEEHSLQHTRLSVGPVHNGAITGSISSTGRQPLYFTYDVIRLLFLVTGLKNHNGKTVRVVGP